MKINAAFVPRNQLKLQDAAQDAHIAIRMSLASKITHPLFIKSYRAPNPRKKDAPIPCIGLDVETEATTGEPRLLGFFFPRRSRYMHVDKPSLDTFARIAWNMADNSDGQFVVWSRLDLQVLLRLFNPNKTEQERISRGISARIDKRGRLSNAPPIERQCKRGFRALLLAYIPGRALKFAIIKDGWAVQVWVSNIAQFYATRLETAALGARVEWRTMPKETHVIDWQRFSTDPIYKESCYQSNLQDARTVSLLTTRLQDNFAQVIGAYPSLLISTGSLADAACSSMMEKEDYAACNFEWLATNVWEKQPNEAALLRVLCGEAFSAGYVDQYCVGYCEDVWTADLASAYPAVIRSLRDLRKSYLVHGKNNVEGDCLAIESKGYTVETVVIRGVVNIPASLRWHPITTKSSVGENYRPIGTFGASYTREERDYCLGYGATFHDEEYIIIAITETIVSPLGVVSETLGKLRTNLLAQKAAATDPEERASLDGQQYIVKVIDNSLYGKTVMTTDVIEDTERGPEVVGLTAGDRFNQLWGMIITARTRCRIAAACMEIAKRGGDPLLVMTDAVYWRGEQSMLPGKLIRTVKTAGFFELPYEVHNFYMLKSGLYEYQKGGTFEHRLRGLSVDREAVSSKAAFLRPLVINATRGSKEIAENIIVDIPTNRLITIGTQKLDLLGAIVKGNTELHPYRLANKMLERVVINWRASHDDLVFLNNRIARDTTHQLLTLSNLFVTGLATRATQKKTLTRKRVAKITERKKEYAEMHGAENPTIWAKMRWPILQRFFPDAP